MSVAQNKSLPRVEKRTGEDLYLMFGDHPKRSRHPEAQQKIEVE